MPQVELQNVEPLLEQFEDRRTNLIPILQEVQEAYRYLPQEVLRRISRKLRVPLTEVYQVATFYRCFSLVPRGRHVIQVCLGTDLKLAEPGTTGDLQFTVETVRCIGCCGLAPVARVDNSHTHPHLTQAKVAGLLKKYQPKGEAPTATKPDEASHAKA